MYRQIYCRSNILKNYALGQRKFTRCLSQTFALPRSTLTRVTRNFYNARLFVVSNINISNLRKNGIGVRQFCISAGQLQKSFADTNTKVINNVCIYKYERPKFYAFLNAFSIFQFFFWTGVGYFSYKYLPPWNSNEQTIWQYIWDNWALVVTSLFATILGITSSTALLIFTAKSVRYIILKKGGDMITVVTYAPFKSSIGFTVPLENVTCNTTRKDMKSYLPFKIKGRSFYYVLDCAGEFINPQLFDSTIGLMRFD